MSAEKELSLTERSDHVKHFLGIRIRNLRRNRNLTQNALAEMAHINSAYLGAVERGQANPTIEILTGIACALDIDIASLFIQDTSKQSQSDEQLKHCTSEFIQKVKHLYQWE